jgi:PAS domain S-box-containing protein
MPKIGHIYYISGSAPQELRDAERAREEFDRYQDTFDFIFFEGLPLDDLLNQVGRLQDDSAIIFSTYFRDIDGIPHTPRDVLEYIYAHTNAPIFGLTDTYLGHGIVGGQLTSAEQIGSTAAQIALNILDDKVPADMPPRKVPATNMFDWRELKRWGISEHQLPDNSIVRYRESSFFEIYKWHLLLGAGIVLIQTVLIAFLLVTLSRRKAAEKALSGSEKKYRRLVESLRDGIISIDKNNTITGFNTGAAQIFGYREREVVGRPITTLIPNNESRRQLDNIDDVVKNDIFLEYESTRLNKNGNHIPVRIILSALKNESDKIIGLIEIVRDTSQQKLAEQEKEQLEMALQQAHKMEAIGTLAGGIAHDFNNILAAIIGFTEFSLLDVDPGSSVESNLQEVIKAGKRARDLVNQILTYARRNYETVKPISVHPIAVDALKLIRSMTPSSIDIRHRIETESLIVADPVKIQQIFINICVNAVQSMKDGGRLEVFVNDVPKNDLPLEHHRRLPLNDYLKIEISDTGSGIAENILALIFEPYFTTKEVGSGTGLGLSVVHGIVKSYGGEIIVDSVIDQGTTFTVYFPITKEKQTKTLPRPTNLPRGNEKILVVDDEPAVLRIISQQLNYLGYRVTTRTDSADALALFQKNPNDFDLIITDMTMPAFCGDVLAQEIRKIRSDIPIVLCTGFSHKLTNGTPDGVNALLEKPVEQAKLAKCVRMLLDSMPGTGMKK